MTGGNGEEKISVTVTFLEMTRPPANYSHPPVNRQIALLKTRNMPLHFYRYLMDRVGRKWHWVNVLRQSDEELAAGIHALDRDIRVLYLDGAPAGFFDLKPHLPEEVELAYFGMMEHATGQGIGRWFLGAAIEAAWSLRPNGERADLHARPPGSAAALPEARLLAGRPEAGGGLPAAVRGARGKRHAANSNNLKALNRSFIAASASIRHLCASPSRSATEAKETDHAEPPLHSCCLRDTRIPDFCRRTGGHAVRFQDRTPA